METQIKITLPEVLSIAKKLRSINEEMFKVLSDASKVVNELSATWHSPTSSTFEEKFQKFSLNFLEEKETLENYVNFLEETVSNYDSLESTMNSNAENF